MILFEKNYWKTGTWLSYISVVFLGQSLWFNKPLALSPVLFWNHVVLIVANLAVIVWRYRRYAKQKRRAHALNNFLTHKPLSDDYT